MITTDKVHECTLVPSKDLPDPNNVRIIISDCDGTLLNSKHELTEKTIKNINYVIDNYNVNFIIATGKTRYSVTHLREQLNIVKRKNCIAVHSNGCVIYDDKDEIFKEYLLQKDIVLKNIELYKKYLEGKDYSYVLYVRETLYVPRDDKWAQFLREYSENVAVVEDSKLLEMINNEELKVNKVCVLTTPKIFYEFMNEPLQEFIKSNEGIAFVTGHKLCYETLPEDISKGVALEYIMKSLNVTPDQVMAFGDGLNDYTMFEKSGYKYAMGNSPQELIDVATCVTKTNDEDGLAYVLEETFMKNTKN